MAIRYVKNKDINLTKWDNCIKHSVGGIVYAYSWYLNIVCESWDALIEDDYISVMPLPVTRILGINTVYIPNFIYQLGIFSLKPLPSEKAELFLSAIPRDFKIINLRLNRLINITTTKFMIDNEKKCFELDLIKPYKKLSGQYSKQLAYQLHKDIGSGLSVVQGIAIKELFRFYYLHEKYTNESKLNEYLNMLKIIMVTAIKYRIGEIFGTYSPHNELRATALLLRSHNRITIIHTCIDEKNTGKRGLNLLIDKIIRKHSEKNITLSFEYTNKQHPGSIYKNFGARESRVQSMKKNTLPFYLKWINHLVYTSHF